MTLIGRTPIRISATPSTAPQEAMAASLQQHIDELVQQNRTTEHELRRARQALEDEKERAREAMARVKAATLREREAWREGCDSLLASHRIVHLRTQNELAKARIALAATESEGMQVARMEVLQRDHRLLLFQAKEDELEARITDLQFELEEVEDRGEAEKQEIVDQYEDVMSVLKARLDKAVAARREASSRVKASEAELKSLQSEIAKLRTENSKIKSLSDSISTKLERATLQLDGMKTKVNEMEDENAELKGSIAEYKRQLEKWQSLESKGDAEKEGLRKNRDELKTQVRELQESIKELERVEKEHSKALAKEQKQKEKLRIENEKMAEEAQKAQSTVANARAEQDTLQRELARSQKLIEKLQLQVSSAAQDRKGKKPSREAEFIASDDETEQRRARSERSVEVIATSNSKVRKNTRNASRGPTDIEVIEKPPAKRTKGSSHNKEVTASGKKRKSRPSASDEERAEDHSEEEEVIEIELDDDSDNPLPKKKNKGKGRASEVLSKPASKKHVNRKDRTKSDSEEEASKAGQKNGRAALGRSTSQKRSSKQNSQRKSSADSEEGNSHGAQSKKKKRLLAPEQMTFNWNDFPTGNGGLGIPTSLSPVKETATVPRSAFGRLGWN